MISSDKFAGTFWLELREPRCVPDRKGPFSQENAAVVLREFMKEWPRAFITVVSIGHDGPTFQDGPECLMMVDGRSRSVALAHIERTEAEFNRITDRGRT